MRATTKGLLVFAFCMTFAAANIFDLDLENKEDDMNLEVKKGDLMRINLKENPSTGYVWRF